MARAPKKKYYIAKRDADGLTREERFDLLYEVLLLAKQEMEPEADNLELTQREVGDLLGIDHARVSLIEIGAIAKIRAQHDTQKNNH